jgi:hypothetical protein
MNVREMKKSRTRNGKKSENFPNAKASHVLVMFSFSLLLLLLDV